MVKRSSTGVTLREQIAPLREGIEMFGRREATTTTYPDTRTEVVSVERAPVARGGVSFSAILTGVVVAFGAMFLLAALVAGIITATGLAEPGAIDGQAIEIGLGAGFALVVAQFLAYLWGGYTAGRMGRGAGAANGLLVALTAIVVAGLVAGIATALGQASSLNMPFTVNRLPGETDFLVDLGVSLGIASLVAMFLGAIVGGVFGARWHTRLEQAVYEREVQTREVDLRDSDVSATTTGVVAGPNTTVRRVPDDETPISTGPSFRSDT
jgi:hypothetical protein